MLPSARNNNNLFDGQNLPNGRKLIIEGRDFIASVAEEMVKRGEYRSICSNNLSLTYLILITKGKRY